MGTQDDATGTMYVKGLPKAVQDDMNRCARQETPEPLTLRDYLTRCHQFYQARKGMGRLGPTIEATGAAPGGPAPAAAASQIGDMAALLHGLAAVAEHVKGNSVVARAVRRVIVHQLAPYAPAEDEARQATRRPRLAVVGRETDG